jgi:serine/threonine protein kinase
MTPASNAQVLPVGTSSDFVDGFGCRQRHRDGAGAELVETLRLHEALTAVPGFDFALRERVGRLANFRHAYYASVRKVDRIDNGATLALVGDTVEGSRLSRILEIAHTFDLDLDVNAALCLLRQIVPAVAMLHQNARDVSHGALAPERILVTPNARVVLVEYVLGSAIESLSYSRERLW